MSKTLRHGTFAVLIWALLVHPAALSGQDARGARPPVVHVVTGDPDRAGPFVERITFAAGFHTDPHAHSVDLTETVLRGRLMQGLGAAFDTSRVVALLPGSTLVVKAGVIHYDWWPAGGELEIRGTGPVGDVIVDSTGKPVPPR